MNNGGFLSSANAFYFFSLLFTGITKSFNTMLNRSGESRYSYVGFYLKGNDFITIKLEIFSSFVLFCCSLPVKCVHF